jgi:hypothetical protein
MVGPINFIRVQFQTMLDQRPTWMMDDGPHTRLRRLAALLDPSLARAVVLLHTTQGVAQLFFPWTRYGVRVHTGTTPTTTALSLLPPQVPNMAIAQAARPLASTSYRGGICLTPRLDGNQTTAPWSPGRTCLWP